MFCLVSVSRWPAVMADSCPKPSQLQAVPTSAHWTRPHLPHMDRYYCVGDSWSRKYWVNMWPLGMPLSHPRKGPQASCFTLPGQPIKVQLSVGTCLAVWLGGGPAPGLVTKGGASSATSLCQQRPKAQIHTTSEVSKDEAIPANATGLPPPQAPDYPLMSQVPSGLPPTPPS